MLPDDFGGVGGSVLPDKYYKGVGLHKITTNPVVWSATANSKKASPDLLGGLAKSLSDASASLGRGLAAGGEEVGKAIASPFRMMTSALSPHKKIADTGSPERSKEHRHWPALVLQPDELRFRHQWGRFQYCCCHCREPIDAYRGQ